MVSWQTSEQTQRLYEESAKKLKHSLYTEQERATLLKAQVALLEDQLRAASEELEVFRQLDVYKATLQREFETVRKQRSYDERAGGEDENRSMVQSMPPPPPRTTGGGKASADEGHGGRCTSHEQSEIDPYHPEMAARKRVANPSSPGHSSSGRTSPANSHGLSSGRASPVHSQAQPHQGEHDRVYLERARERERELNRQLDQDHDVRHRGRGDAPSPSLSKLFSADADGTSARSAGSGGDEVDINVSTGGQWEQPAATALTASATWSTPKDKRRLSIVELESLGSDAGGASYGLLPSRPSLVAAAAASPPLDELKPTQDEMRMAKEALLRGR